MKNWPPSVIWKFILGFTPMALVKCAIELGIADILEKHESPMTLVDLALEIGCSQSSLYRIMRWLFGGGDGTAIRSIVEAFPWIKGINYDLPHVVSVSPACNGIEHVGGNMFDHVPKADGVLLMKVLHDWTEEDCIRILRNCRNAIPQDGKVIIVDAIVGRKEDHEFKEVGLLLDMVMIAHTSDGKERTIDEWSYVLHEAGFTRYTLKHIQTYQSVIEVFP
ncbi:caffeate O-methyltransferase family protein [Tanacetum coccineum]